MSQKIASLYADIGANTTGLKQGLGETKTGLQKAASDFSNFQSKALTAFAGVGAAVFAAKKAFDFSKEGAQLEFIRGKFDRLAESAGATGDALLQSLRNATRDTVSDVQLMASATDFLGLGLAKTADEAIRMTRVAGALGMNMNQLVLTLTNQTTMRFDALGVAVDGFDAKVKALKDTGMDANAAFTEAFLQQAEAQIEKVGDIADTSAGQIMQLESAWRNFIDANKEAAAGFAGTTTGITGTLKYMGLLRQAVNDGRMSLAEANLEMLRWGIGAKDADQAVGELQAETVDLAVVSNKAAKAIDYVALAQEGMAKNAEAAAKGLNDEIGFMEGLEGAAGRVQGILDALDVTISPELDLGAVTNQIMASGAIQKLGEAFSKGLISETQYKQAFAEVATTLGDMTAEQVQKAFSLFDIQSLFDQTVEGAPDQVPAALQSYIDSLRGLSDTDYSAQEEMASSAEIMAEKLPAAATGAEDLAAGLGNAQQPAQNFSNLVNDELEPGITKAEKATKKWVDYIAELKDKKVTITYNEEHNISYNYSSSGSGGGQGFGGAPPPNCFAPGTPVAMANGEDWPIEDVQIGDSVMAFNERTLEFSAGRVSATIARHAPVRLRFSLANGAQFVCTPAHPFYQPGAAYRGRRDFIAASDLDVGDELYQPGADSLTRVRIETIEQLPGGPVHNLTVEPQHTYIAASVMVHNVKAATGLADFTVPAGYPNDSYPIWVTSGERVNVETAAQRASAQSAMTAGGNGGGGSMINYNYISDFTTAEYYARAQARAARFARINAHMGV